MNADEYQTIVEPGRAQTRVLGSRFLGLAVFAVSPDEALRYLELEKKQSHDATHWCFAMRLGCPQPEIEKSSDAGEPHGTAGLPILREIQKRELVNTLVIVTRWFGGTKLGTGNLARAYSDCAGLALDAATIELRKILKQFRAVCAHDDQGILYALAKRFQASIIAEPATDCAVFQIRISPDKYSLLIRSLVDESGGRIKITGEDV
jgi:putative IMPACT (imprinted ancient) family translation regulator